MTCKEFRQLLPTIRGCTRAEQIAMALHCFQCVTCNHDVDESAARFTVEDPVASQKAYRDGRQVTREALKDPEIRDTIRIALEGQDRPK